MILVISMRNRKDYDQRDRGTGLKRRVEQLTGHPVLTMHYADACPVTVDAVNPHAVLITGSPDPWPTIRMPDLYGLKWRAERSWSISSSWRGSSKREA